MIEIAETKSGLIFKVKVQPSAPKDEIIGEYDGGLKIRLKAPPVGGKANEACIKFLAKVFNVSRQSIDIVRGEISTIKIIRVAGISKEAFNKIQMTKSK